MSIETSARPSSKAQINSPGRHRSRFKNAVFAAMTLAGTNSNLESRRVDAVAFSTIANEPTLFAMRQKYIKNPVAEHRRTDQTGSSFLLPPEPTNVGQDFVSCIAGYFLHTEQFALLVHVDPALQAKFDLLAEHFSSGPQTVTIGLS
jgi:hypothetical protein